MARARGGAGGGSRGRRVSEAIIRTLREAYAALGERSAGGRRRQTGMRARQRTIRETVAAILESVARDLPVPAEVTMQRYAVVAYDATTGERLTSSVVTVECLPGTPRETCNSRARRQGTRLLIEGAGTPPISAADVTGRVVRISVRRLEAI